MTREQCFVIVCLTIAMCDAARPDLSMLTRLERLANCMKCPDLEKCYPHNASVRGGAVAPYPARGVGPGKEEA